MHVQKTVLKATSKTSAVTALLAEHWTLDRKSRVEARSAKERYEHQEKFVVGATHSRANYMHIWGV